MKRTQEEIARDIKRQAKVCNKCGKLKDFEEFYNETIKSDGKNSSCKLCQNGRTKKWRDLKREDYLQSCRNSSLKSRYGITLEEYKILLKEQKSKCAICGSEETRRKGTENLAVDHDHETGKIRGLLCHKCNRGIGFLQDSTEVLKKAIIYLGGRNAFS